MMCDFGRRQTTLAIQVAALFFDQLTGARE
jgi:hypothetical protein